MVSIGIMAVDSFEFALNASYALAHVNSCGAIGHLQFRQKKVALHKDSE